MRERMKPVPRLTSERFKTARLLFIKSAVSFGSSIAVLIHPLQRDERPDIYLNQTDDKTPFLMPQDDKQGVHPSHCD
jgi:hypothetical protein